MATAGTVIYPAQQLDTEIRSKGIPILGVSGPSWDGVTEPRPLTPWTVTYDPSATQAQKDQGNALAAAFDGQDRVYRSLLDIYTDFTALTLNQRGKVWQNINALGPGGIKLYYTDRGPNAVTLSIYDFLIFNSGLATAATDEAKTRLIAAYVQDNPYYLDAPAFDVTIKLLGVE